MTKPTDQTVTQFWSAYIDLAQKIAPVLPVGEKPHRSAGQTVFTFEGFELAPDLRLRHVSGSGTKDGHVCLERYDRDASDGERMNSLLSTPNVPYGVRFRDTGKYAFIEIRTPPLDMSLPASEQLDAIELGIRKAEDLYQWALSNIGSEFFD